MAEAPGSGPWLVAADMDGTFLATDKHVPDKNLRMLDRLFSLHIPFVPCTGRSVSAVPQEVLQHAATRYVVAANGAVVFDVGAGSALMVAAMDKEQVLRLYEAVEHLDVTFDVFADGGIFAERWRYEAMSSFGIDRPSLEVLRRVRTPQDLSVPELVERAACIEKITCFWKTEHDRDALADSIAKMGCFAYASGHPKNFELQSEGVSKGSGLVWLCGHTGVPLANAITFGDEANDLAALAAVGDGVAMANATDEVKAKADHLTLSNDEAGVAWYVEGWLKARGL